MSDKIPTKKSTSSPLVPTWVGAPAREILFINPWPLVHRNTCVRYTLTVAHLDKALRVATFTEEILFLHFVAITFTAILPVVAFGSSHLMEQHLFPTQKLRPTLKI